MEIVGKDERWRGMRGVESCESVDGEKVAVSRILLWLLGGKRNWFEWLRGKRWCSWVRLWKKLSGCGRIEKVEVEKVEDRGDGRVEVEDRGSGRGCGTMRGGGAVK